MALSGTQSWCVIVPFDRVWGVVFPFTLKATVKDIVDLRKYIAWNLSHFQDCETPKLPPSPDRE
eukprot:4949862-Amphidinium_carterae.1